MGFQFVKHIREDPILRNRFFELAKEVFELSFEEWYQKGFWTNRYIPYSFADNNKIIANASVNIMDTVWNGEPRRYIQIGTVMTDPSYRGKGLSRRLMEEILSDWEQKCDGIYLFSNGTVLDFYPKFGFVSAPEYQFERSVPLTKERFSFIKLEMDLPENQERLKHCYQDSNPFSRLPMNHQYGLLMFYFLSEMKDCVYYAKELDMIAVAKQEGETLICYDIFGRKNASLDSILSSLSGIETKKIVFGFSPKEPKHGILLKRDPLQDDTTLFIYNQKENLFSNHKLMFPILSHA